MPGCMSSPLSSSQVRQCDEIIFYLGKASLLFRYILLLCFLSRVYQSYTLQSVHHAVAMQWPSVLLYGFDP